MRLLFPLVLVAGSLLVSLIVHCARKRTWPTLGAAVVGMVAGGALGTWAGEQVYLMVYGGGDPVADLIVGLYYGLLPGAAGLGWAALGLLNLVARRSASNSRVISD